VVKEPPASNNGATTDASTIADRNQANGNQNATVANQGPFGSIPGRCLKMNLLAMSKKLR